MEFELEVVPSEFSLSVGGSEESAVVRLGGEDGYLGVLHCDCGVKRGQMVSLKEVREPALGVWVAKQIR